MGSSDHRTGRILMASHRVILVVGSILLLGAASGHAQDRRVMEDRSRGEVELGREVAVLSFKGLDVAPDALAQVFELPGGGWGVSSDVFDGAIQLFDAEGEPAGTLGRGGQGPGEFGGQVFAVKVGGRLWTADPRNARLSAFDENLELEEDRRLPGRVFSVAPTAHGSSVLVAGFLGEGTGEHGLARMTMDEDQDVLGGHLEDHPNPRVQIHMAAQPSQEAVWTVATSGGGVNVLEASDLSVREHLRLPDEELRELAQEPLPRDEPPPPHLTGVMGDEEGRLWILFGVPARDWTPDLGPGDGVHRMLDTRVLVVDPAESAVIGRGTLEEVCVPIVRGRISCVDERDASIRVVELELASGDG